MNLNVFCTLWDTFVPIEKQIERIAMAGFEGVEVSRNTISISPEEFTKLRRQYNLNLIISDTIQDKADLDTSIKQLLEYEPSKIVLRSGRDDMTRDEGSAFFEEALNISQAISVPQIGHETHRGTLLFTPWDTTYYLKKFDNLRLVADYSHWLVVTGRLLHDHSEAMDLANHRSIHIHGRIGSVQSPQVADPTAPENDVYLHWFSFHWDQIRQHYIIIGAPPLTFTPDYRPPPYLPTLPHTNMPIIDLWEISKWSARHARSILD